jgi:rRNA-processing protein FCF1
MKKTLTKEAQIQINDAYAFAISNSCIDELVKLKEMGVAPSYHTLCRILNKKKECCKNEIFEALKWIWTTTFCLVYACDYENVVLLQHMIDALRENGAKHDIQNISYAYWSAMREPNLACFKCLHKNGFEISDAVCRFAHNENYHHAIKYMKECGLMK